MAELLGRLRQALAAGRLQLPLPGGGATWARHEALMSFGREDLSLARLAEAHTDAIAIFAEAGRQASRDRLYGVWASEGPGSSLELTQQTDGTWILSGSKRYCSGASLLDAALVTARHGECGMLMELPLDVPGLTIETAGWAAPAFAETATATVHCDAVQLSAASVIGVDDWYLRRPGFWHGALGPAACWAGGALGLIDAALALKRREPHAQAQSGALAANAWALRAILLQAADEIDADPQDQEHARQRALKARHIIERMCTDTLERFGRATGPQLLAFDASVAQRYAELTLYIRQSHAERDLQALMTG